MTVREHRDEVPQLIGDLRRALRSKDPLEPVVLVSSLMSVLDRPDTAPDVPSLALLVDSFIDIEYAETTAALHIMAMLTGDDLLRRRIRGATQQRRHPLPRTVADLEHTHVTRALAVEDALGTSTNYVLECAFPGAGPLCVIVYVDHSRGGAATDGFPADIDIDGYLAFLDASPEGYLLQARPVGLADVRAALEPALAASFDADGPDRETWPQSRPLIQWLVRRLPEGGRSPLPSPAAAQPGAAFGVVADGRGVPERSGSGDVLDGSATVQYRVRVDLEGVSPSVWRELLIPSSLPLAVLHVVLQLAMGWADLHLHAFSVEGPDGHDVTLVDPTTEEGVEQVEATIPVAEVLTRPGDVLTYTYDFGGGWRHTLRLEAIEPLGDDTVRCTGGAGACPPEDIGGPAGYAAAVAAGDVGEVGSFELVDDVPRLPPGFDPEEFNPEAVDVTLRLHQLNPEELASVGVGPLPTHPALDDLIGRLPPTDVFDIAALSAAAVDARDQRPTGAALAAAVRPWRVLLDLAGRDGIELTSAGWMRPAAVQHVFTTLGFEATWIGKGNREEHTAPVRSLRASAVRMKLLRVHRGRLVPLKAVRGLDDAALWDHLTAHVLTGLGEADTDAGVLALLHVAANGAAGATDSGGSEQERRDFIAHAMTRAGWSRGGSPLSRLDIVSATQAVDGVLGLVAGPSRRYGGPYPPAVAAFAADVLFAGLDGA